MSSSLNLKELIILMCIWRLSKSEYKSWILQEFLEMCTYYWNDTFEVRYLNKN